MAVTKTITRPSRFELAISHKVWGVAGVLAFSMLGILSLAYEWSSWYSDGMQIYLSRVGWGLIIAIAGITNALFQMTFLAVWVGTDMSTRKRTTVPFAQQQPSHQAKLPSTTDKNAPAKPDPTPVPTPRMCCSFCPCITTPNEYAPIVYQRRVSLVNAMQWCDAIQLLCLLLGFHTTNVFRIFLLCILVGFTAYSVSMTLRMTDAMNFWFAKPSENDTYVLRPLTLMPTHLSSGWRATRTTFVYVFLVYVTLFASQYYYMYGHTQSLLESQRLLLSGNEYLNAVGEFQHEFAALAPAFQANATAPPRTPLVWVWVWDGLPCAFSDVTLSPTADMHVTDTQCLEVLSPDTADSTWYSMLTGAEPAFLGRRFFRALHPKPEALSSSVDTEIYSAWQTLELDFTEPALQDIERVIRESWQKLTDETFGSDEYAVNYTKTNENVRIVRVQSSHWIQSTRHFQLLFRKWTDILQQYTHTWCTEDGHDMNPLADRDFTWVITATHSSSLTDTFGGTIPQDDTVRRYVPWHVLALKQGSTNEACRTHASYTAHDITAPPLMLPEDGASVDTLEPYRVRMHQDRFGNIITGGTIADVYPTVQMLRLRPLSVFSTGAPILSTTTRVWSARVGPTLSHDVHALYDTHLSRLRAVLARHAQLSIGIQSTIELLEHENAFQNQGFGNADDTVCYSKRDLIDRGLLHANVTSTGFVRPSHAAELDVLLSILQDQIDQQQRARYMTAGDWATWHDTLKLDAFWLAVTRNELLAIVISFALFMWLRGTVYARTLWVDTTFSFHPKLIEIIAANHNEEFVDLVTYSLVSALGYLCMSVLVVFGGLCLIYVFGNGLTLLELDFHVFHLGTHFNGLAIYFSVCVVGSTLVNAALHFQAHYRLQDRERNPQVKAVDADERVPLVQKHDKPERVVNVWGIQRETTSVQHLYSLVSHMFVHVFVYGVLFCVEASYMAPFPVAAPTWFASDVAAREVWKAQTVLLIMIPATCCVLVRAFWYEPRMYAAELSKPAVPDSTLEASKQDTPAAAADALPKQPRRAIQHTLDEVTDIPRLELTAGSWTRLYAFKDAMLE